MKTKSFGLQWHITDKCDQRCKHCYIYDGKEKEDIQELPLETLSKIFENFIEFCDEINKKPFIVLTGGDPLLHENIWELLELLHENNIKFFILGNPFHLDLNVALKLKKLGCTNYQMSLDGLKETHDKIRKPGSFDSTLSKISVLKEAQIPVSIMSTVSNINLNEIPELIDIVVENKVDNFAFARFCPNSKEDYALLPKPLEYRDFLDKIWHKYEQHKHSKTRLALKDHLWKLYLYEENIIDISYIHNPNNLILDGCHCGISHMTVLANGEVYACRRSITPIGKVPEQNFKEIFFGNKMEYYRQFDKFEGCSSCELKHLCRGCPSVANSLTGNFFSKDPQCWKI